MNLYAYIASNNPRKANMLLRETTDLVREKRRAKLSVGSSNTFEKRRDEALERDGERFTPIKNLLIGDGQFRVNS